MSTRGRSTRRFKQLARNLRAQGHECWNYPNCEGIDYDAPPGHPRAFTVDHIRPLSIYPEGAEDPANLRASCHGCNASRGDGRTRPGVTYDHHNYSPDAGAITSSDWGGDWEHNTWHRSNPYAPCPCRTPAEPAAVRTYAP